MGVLLRLVQDRVRANQPEELPHHVAVLFDMVAAFSHPDDEPEALLAIALAVCCLLRPGWDATGAAELWEEADLGDAAEVVEILGDVLKHPSLKAAKAVLWPSGYRRIDDEDPGWDEERYDRVRDLLIEAGWCWDDDDDDARGAALEGLPAMGGGEDAG
jgi:hypothetical protein